MRNERMSRRIADADNPGAYDQRLARWLMRPFVNSRLAPNHVTTATLILCLVAAVLFATGHGPAIHVAAGLFVLARFLDHGDGELARMQGTASRLGARYDYVAGALSYAALFIGIGIGLSDSWLGAAALVLTVLGVLAGFAHMLLRVTARQARVGRGPDGGSDGMGQAAGDYPRFGRFDLEDGIYLLAPATWLGGLAVFFVLAAAGAVVFALWTAFQQVRETMPRSHGPGAR